MLGEMKGFMGGSGRNTEKEGDRRTRKEETNGRKK